MTQGSQMYTPTLARIYEAQGHYEKAAGVYQHLLKLEPFREDLAEKLARVRQKGHRTGL